jgi:hypothetical protein
MVTESLRRSKILIRAMQELFFSLNLILAAALLLLAQGFVFISANGRFEPRTAFKYYFLRATDRIAALLHVTPSTWIQEFASLFSVACLVICFVGLMRLLYRTAFHRIILNPIAGMTASLAIPMAWFYVAHLVGEAHLEMAQGQQLRMDPLGLIMLCYGLIILAFFFLTRRRTPAVWVLHALFVLQSGLWIWLIAETWNAVTGAFYHQHLVPYLAITTFPCTVYAWILYLKQSRSDTSLSDISGNRWKYALVVCLTSLILLAVLWLPRPSTSLANAKGAKSPVVIIARSPCFGPCPTYTLTIRDGGSVEYAGKRFVRISGPETTTIGASQFTGLLHDLDDVHFFALDDQAFERCNDTAKVTVSVSLDGKAKSVTSDSYCVGSKSGPQARLVAITEKIDAMAGSDRWVRCSDLCIH